MQIPSMDHRKPKCPRGPDSSVPAEPFVGSGRPPAARRTNEHQRSPARSPSLRRCVGRAREAAVRYPAALRGARSSSNQVSCTSCQAIAITKITVRTRGTVRDARSSHCWADTFCKSRMLRDEDITCVVYRPIVVWARDIIRSLRRLSQGIVPVDENRHITQRASTLSWPCASRSCSGARGN